MNAKTSVSVICGEGIIYLLLYNLHDCVFICSSSKGLKSEITGVFEKV